MLKLREWKTGVDLNLAVTDSWSRRKSAQTQISLFYPRHVLPLTELTVCVRDAIAVETRNRHASASSGARDFGQSTSALVPRPI